MSLAYIPIENSDEKSWCKNREIYRQKARKILDVEEPAVCLFVGRFCKEKGINLLLNILPQLNKSIGYYFVGGKIDCATQRFINDHNLNNVHVVDFKTQEELSVYFRVANLFVLPTLHDVWGLVISEAMAYGLPIVTTDLCGAGLELVEEGKNGLLCRADDKMSLKNALEKVMQMDLNHLGFQSYKKIQRYTIENMALAHFNYFKNKGDRN